MRQHRGHFQLNPSIEFSHVCSLGPAHSSSSITSSQQPDIILYLTLDGCQAHKHVLPTPENEYITSSSNYQDDNNGYTMKTNQELELFNKTSNAYGSVPTVTQLPE